MAKKFLSLDGLKYFFNKIIGKNDISGIGDGTLTGAVSEFKSKLDGIDAGANKYTHPTYTARSSGLYKIKVTSTGHVSAATEVTKSDITNLGIPSTNTTYSKMTAATADAAGAAGLVPAPAAGAQAKFLRGDGKWATPTNTTYSTFVKSGSDAAAGLVPKPSTTEGTTKYLREDGKWVNPVSKYLPLTGGKLTGSIEVTQATGEFSGSFITSKSQILCVVSQASGGYVSIGGKAGVHVVDNNNDAFTDIQAASFTKSSSEKVKDNIVPITEDEAKKILDVDIVSFDYKEKFGGKKGEIGVIAEWTRHIVPNAVVVPTNYNEDAFDEEKGINQPILGVDYTKFVPYLIKMVQMQQKEIDQLTRRLEKLEEKITLM